MGINPDRYIPVGRIGAPHGLNGVVKVVSFTEAPEDIFTYQPWYLTQNKKRVEMKIEHSATQGRNLVAKLVDCDSKDLAQQWTNAEIAIKREQLPPLEEGQHYWSDLEGMSVKTLQGVTLGVVSEVIETGANPVLVIEGNERYLVPYVPSEIVKNVSMSSNELIVDWDVDY